MTANRIREVLIRHPPCSPVMGSSCPRFPTDAACIDRRKFPQWDYMVGKELSGPKGQSDLKTENRQVTLRVPLFDRFKTGGLARFSSRLLSAKSVTCPSSFPLVHFETGHRHLLISLDVWHRSRISLTPKVILLFPI